MSAGEHTGKPRGTRDLIVDHMKYPGWVSGMVRLPAPGERVLTNEGLAVVVRVLGKTSVGGRLLELTMDDGRKPAFFASAANVVVPPEGTTMALPEGQSRESPRPAGPPAEHLERE
jgi:hypothetical protein